MYEGACGRILEYESRGFHLDGHPPRGDGELCTRGHVAGRGVCVILVLVLVVLAAAGRILLLALVSS